MAKIQKTILSLEVDNKEWCLRFNGSVDFPKQNDKVAFKHDERIMQALVSDERLFKLFYRLVNPAYRFYQREAKKKIRNNKG